VKPGAALSDDQPRLTGAPHLDRLMAAVPFKYGWVILGAGALGAFMTAPGQTVGVSAFFDPIIEDTGLSRGEAAAAYAIGTCLGILPAPLFGRWIDRRGVRLAALVTCPALAVACGTMALAHSALQLAFAFAFLRGTAVAGLALLSQYVINLWFVRRRGIAVSAAIGGTALGGVVFPQLIEAMLAPFGWRMTYAAIGVLIAVTVWPVTVLLFRDKPETFGLEPDFGIAPKPGTNPVQEPVVTLSEAMRTGAFWILTAAGFLSNMVGTALLLHQVSILAGGGIARTAAVALLAPFAAIQAGTTPLAGMLIDRYRACRLLPIILLVLAAAALSVTFVHSVLGGWAM
jgi:MFS family permease